MRLGSGIRATALAVVVGVGVAACSGGAAAPRHSSFDQAVASTRHADSAPGGAAPTEVDTSSAIATRTTAYAGGGTLTPAVGGAAVLPTKQRTAALVSAVDDQHHVLATGLVLRLPGLLPGKVTVDYTSTAFDQAVTMPPLLTSDPLQLLVLRALADESPALPRLADLLAAHAAKDPDYLKHPTGAEGAALAALIADLLQRVRAAAPQGTGTPTPSIAPSVSTGGLQIQPADYRDGGSTALVDDSSAGCAATATPDDDADTGLEFPQLFPTSKYSVGVCTYYRGPDKPGTGLGRLYLVNNGGWWAEVHTTKGAGPMDGLVGFVPPMSSELPTVEDMVGAVVDAGSAILKAVGKYLVKHEWCEWTGSHCNRIKPDFSGVLDSFKKILDGRDSSGSAVFPVPATAAGGELAVVSRGRPYQVAVSLGDATRPGESPFSEQLGATATHAQRRIVALTVMTQYVLPTVAVLSGMSEKLAKVGTVTDVVSALDALLQKSDVEGQLTTLMDDLQHGSAGAVLCDVVSMLAFMVRAPDMWVELGKALGFDPTAAIIGLAATAAMLATPGLNLVELVVKTWDAGVTFYDLLSATWLIRNTNDSYDELSEYGCFQSGGAGGGSPLVACGSAAPPAPSSDPLATLRATDWRNFKGYLDFTTDYNPFGLINGSLVNSSYAMTLLNTQQYGMYAGQPVALVVLSAGETGKPPTDVEEYLFTTNAHGKVVMLAGSATSVATAGASMADSDYWCHGAFRLSPQGIGEFHNGCAQGSQGPYWGRTLVPGRALGGEGVPAAAVGVRLLNPLGAAVRITGNPPHATDGSLTTWNGHAATVNAPIPDVSAPDA